LRPDAFNVGFRQGPQLCVGLANLRRGGAMGGCMTKLEPVLEQIGRDFPSALSRYIEFLRIPSVSADPAYKEQVARAGAWLENEFSSFGFTAKLHETPGHPILLAHYESASPGAPHLLYYGHYDVQPPEPLELWDTPPFEPAIIDGPHGKR